MKRLLALTVGLMILGASAQATWDDAAGRSGFAYWQTGGDWFTILTFVNGSEVDDETIYIRFYDVHGNPCSDTTADMFSIRGREMLIFTTHPHVGNWIPTSADYGYILFRTEGGGAIHAYCVIFNFWSGSGYVIPAFRPEDAF